METKKINKLSKLTSLKLQWNMSISDYNNDRISEKELKLKWNELSNKVWEYLEELENGEGIGSGIELNWRHYTEVIDLKQYKQSVDSELKSVA